MCHWHQSCRWTVEFQVIRACLEKQISNICETGRWDHPAAEHSCIAHYSKLAMAAHQKYTKHSHREHDTVPTFSYREHRSVPETQLHFHSINIKITLKQRTTHHVPRFSIDSGAFVTLPRPMQAPSCMACAKQDQWPTHCTAMAVNYSYHSITILVWSVSVPSLSTAREQAISTGRKPPLNTGSPPGTAQSVLNTLVFSTGRADQY